VLAVDVGGTKLAAAVIERDGRLLASDRRPTPITDSADEIYAALDDLCRAVMHQAALADLPAIGVGCGGPMDYAAGRVSPAWRDFPLRERLAQSFGRPCVVDNDAKALVLAERWQGAGRGSDNLMGMVVSTGVGGGIVLDGRLLHGHGANAGHVGHIVVWPNGPLCGCGGRGCVEGVASGTGLARRLNAALASGASSTLAAGSTAADIAVAARAGDALAQELFRTAGEGVGRGIASAAALLDLERVVIGGSIALKAWDLLGPPLLDELRRSAKLDFTRDLQVFQAELGETAGLLGAARLAFDSLDV
jgi:glucokinase